MIPCSDIHGDEISKILDQNKLKYSKAVMYRTVASDLSDLSDIKYDMLVFFSPSGVESLFKNFPDFVQNTTRIAAFGATTAQTVIDKGLRLDVMAPMPKAPSMTMAIEQFIASEK
jgi:uroporphyrinogen-III synthase